MNLIRERTANCPLCGRIMDHSGTRYCITTENSTGQTEVCPICYAHIEQARLQRTELQSAQEPFYRKPPAMEADDS